MAIIRQYCKNSSKGKENSLLGREFTKSAQKCSEILSTFSLQWNKRTEDAKWEPFTPIGGRTTILSAITERRPQHLGELTSPVAEHSALVNMFFHFQTALAGSQRARIVLLQRRRMLWNTLRGGWSDLVFIPHQLLSPHQRYLSGKRYLDRHWYDFCQQTAVKRHHEHDRVIVGINEGYLQFTEMFC